MPRKQLLTYFLTTHFASIVVLFSRSCPNLQESANQSVFQSCFSTIRCLSVTYRRVSSVFCLVYHVFHRTECHSHRLGRNLRLCQRHTCIIYSYELMFMAFRSLYLRVCYIEVRYNQVALHLISMHHVSMLRCYMNRCHSVRVLSIYVCIRIHQSISYSYAKVTVC